MADNYNYPMGADADPRAPWHQSDPEPIEVNVTISQTLHRDTTIGTIDYIAEAEEGEGVFHSFSECNFQRDYNEQHYGIPKLLEILKKLAQEKLQTTASTLTYSEKNDLLEVIASCDGWELDESEVIKNE